MRHDIAGCEFDLVDEDRVVRITQEIKTFFM